MSRLLFVLLAALAALPIVAATAGHPDRTAALRGAEYIRATQQPGGGFGPAGQTMDAIFALRAAGLDPNGFVKEGKTSADYLRANAGALTAPALAAKGALAAQALGLDPRNVAGTNLHAAVLAGYTQATGRFAEDDFSQAVAMVGLACTGRPVPNGAVLALRAAQLSDGGWGFGGFSDPDTTAIALQALIAAGVPATDADAAEALANLRATRLPDGGWGFGTESNASSTAFVLQALYAAGENPDGGAWATGTPPVALLRSMQQLDGSFPGFDPAFATNQSVPALAGRSYCDAPATSILPPPSAAAPATPAPPRPPATGSGLAGDGRGQGWAAPVLMGAAILAAATAARAAKRRR